VRTNKSIDSPHDGVVALTVLAEAVLESRKATCELV
jgi:hypothetical protein